MASTLAMTCVMVPSMLARLMSHRHSCCQYDAECVVAHVAEADADRRVLAAGEVVLLLHVDDRALVAEDAGERRGEGAEAVEVAGRALGAKRQFEGGGGKMFGQYVRIVRIDNGVLGRLGEEVIGMTQQVLIDRIVAGQQHGEAFVVTPAAAARLLPTAGDRAGIVYKEGDVERADVDAEFECIGGGDAAEVAIE